MVLIYRTDGECIEVEAAVRAQVMDSSLCCFDNEGNLVATFDKSDVEVFTSDADIADVIKDEACEETTTISA